MNQTMLVHSNRQGDSHVLTWTAPASWARAALDLMLAHAGTDTLPARADRSDPLDAWQEEQAACRVRGLAEQQAAQQARLATRVMEQLVRDGVAYLDDDSAWALACVTNATYVRMRTLDLQQDGLPTSPGEPTAADVDAALARILGHDEPAASTGSTPDHWEPETWLMAVLAHETTEAFTGTH